MSMTRSQHVQIVVHYLFVGLVGGILGNRVLGHHDYLAAGIAIAAAIAYSWTMVLYRHLRRTDLVGRGEPSAPSSD